MSGRRGVTLIELLVVIALVGVLLAVAVVGSRGLIARTAVQEGAQSVARTIDRARTESKRLGVPLRVIADDATRRLQIVDDAANVVFSQTLPPGSVFGAGVGDWAFVTTPVRFVPPHASLEEPIAGTEVLRIEWANDATIVRTAHVTGVFGKVALQ